MLTPILTVDKTEACDATAESTKALLKVLRAAPDPGAMAVGTWTVGHLAAHLAGSTATHYPGYVRGKGSPIESLDQAQAFNDESLKSHLGKPIAETADFIEAGIADFIEVVQATEGDPEVEWLGRLQVPVSMLPAIVLGEMLVHGYDLAKATGAPWKIAPRHAAIVFDGISSLIPYYIAPEAKGFSGSFELSIRGGSKLVVVFDDGEATLESPGRSVDCRISADPVAYLMVGYGRTNQWGAALTGKIFAYGRKPWLGLKLGTLTRNP